jgi:hypothetical protein
MGLPGLMGDALRKPIDGVGSGSVVLGSDMDLIVSPFDLGLC